MNELQNATEQAKEIIRIAEEKARSLLDVARADSPPNSILEVKLDYIQKDIGIIKTDIKEIKMDYITRREHENDIKTVREEISPLRKFIYAIIGIMGITFMGALFQLILAK